ncbi:MAG: CHASE2 domain-containing protein [Vicinamibacterales bacterium]
MHPLLRKLAAGVALGAIAAALALALGAAGLLYLPELKTYDWRMRLDARRADVDRDIALIEINDATIREMSPIFGHWPWPRLALSYVVDYLKNARAKVIAIDIALPEADLVEKYKIGGDEWSGQQSDRALADSVKAAGNVIMLADATYPGLENGQADKTAATWKGSPFGADGRAEPRPVVLPPYQALADASAGFGHNFLALDPDGPARRVAPFVVSGGKQLPSLGVAAALAAGGFRPADVRVDGNALRVGDRAIPLVSRRVGDHDQWSMLIDYRAPGLVNGERPYPSYEFRHLFLSEQQLLAGMKPLIDPALFKDKVVFIGFTAAGLMDVFDTPVSSDQNGTLPGIQLHASVVDSILSNHFIRPAPTRDRLASVALVAIVIGLLGAFLSVPFAAAASLVVLAGWTWLAVHAFGLGLWLNLVQPLSAGAVALFFGTAYQYFVEGREKRGVQRLFGRYVSRDVYAQLMAHPEQAELGGRRRDMTVLFSDIRGFTAVTERGNPEALVGQLNEYFTRMVDIVFRHHGTVDKFVGDMVMALFGAPLDDPDHAEHAVQAAIEMVRELGKLNRGWTARGMAQLDIGVGVNSGDMIAGNIGSASIMSYTVIGDNVNLGSRLESLNKDYKTRIIMSDATRSRLKGDYPVLPLGDVVVKGKSTAVAIFELRVPTPLVSEEHAP